MIAKIEIGITLGIIVKYSISLKENKDLKITKSLSKESTANILQPMATTMKVSITEGIVPSFCKNLFNHY